MAYPRSHGQWANGRTKNVKLLQKHIQLALSEIPQESIHWREKYVFSAYDGNEIEWRLTPMEFFLVVSTILGVEAATVRCDESFCEMQDHQLKS